MFLYNLIAELVYIKNRMILTLLGVKFGKNLRVISLHRIGNPKNIIIGDNVYIGKYVTLGADNGIKIGSNVIISDFVSLLSADHNFSNRNKFINEQGVKPEKESVTIEDDVWIGEKVSILKCVRVGKGSVVGANAVVTKDVPSYVIVAGNPAKLIKNR